MTFTIKKRQDLPTKWNRLLLSDRKQAQMHFWFEMDEKYREELSNIEKGLDTSVAKNTILNTNTTTGGSETVQQGEHPVGNLQNSSTEISTKNGKKPEKEVFEDKAAEEARVRAEVKEKVEQYTKDKQNQEKSKPSSFFSFLGKKDTTTPDESELSIKQQQELR